MLVTSDESRHAYGTANGFVILPEYASWRLKPVDGDRLPSGFSFTSDANDGWVTTEQLRGMAAKLMVTV